MNAKVAVIVALTCLLSLSFAARFALPPVHSIGLANVVVTSIFWGSNPMDPTTAHPGDVNVQLSVVLTNVGDDTARGVNATLNVGPPLTYNYYIGNSQYSVSQISKEAGDLQADQSFTVPFTVTVDPSAREGIYRYDLQLSYKSARELQQINTDAMIDVPLWKGELHVQNIVTVPTKIYPDSKQVVVRTFIVNSGKGEAKDIQLKLDLTPPFTASSSGSDSIYVGSVPTGQTTEADFVLDIAKDANFGSYDVIIGEQSGNLLVPIGQLPLYIDEKVKFDVVNVTPNSVHAGDSGDVIRLDIRNGGSVKADSVRVELRVGNFFTGTLTDFLGTMQSNETKSAFFTVDVDSKAQPGNYSLDLRFDWTQDTNALDDTQSINLTVASPGIPTTLIAVVIVVIAGAGGYFFLRRRRMKAAESTKK